MRYVLAVAIVALAAGCGGGPGEHVRAFSLAMPHGLTRWSQLVTFPGDPASVYVGSVRLARRGRWTCLGPGLASRYLRVAAGVRVELDDGARCSSGVRVRMVGGYGSGGGYVGEWLPAAVLYH